MRRVGSRIDRERPYRVALLADTLRGSAKCTSMYRLTRKLSGALPPYSLTRNDVDYRVFRFPTAETAQIFADRFGGEMLQIDEPRRRR
jgi:hypothetical protein